MGEEQQHFKLRYRKEVPELTSDNLAKMIKDLVITVNAELDASTTSLLEKLESNTLH